MKIKVSALSAVFLGLIFFVFGLNGFLKFIPQPPPPEGALAYLGGLAAAPYFFPLLKGTEIVTGLMLLTGIAAPLALVILAPISIHIFLYHAVLTPGFDQIVLPLIIIALHVAAAVRYWPAYRVLFGLDLMYKKNDVRLTYEVDTSGYRPLVQSADDQAFLPRRSRR